MIAIVQDAVSGHCTPVAAEELLESCVWDLEKTLACLSEGNDEQKVEHRRGNAGPVIEHCMPNKGSLSSTSSSRQALTPTATPMVHSGAVKEPKGRPTTACSRATTSSTSSPGANPSSQPSAVHCDVARVRLRTILVKIVQSIVLRRRVRSSRTAGARPHLAALGGVGMAMVNVVGAQALAGSLAAGLVDQGHHWCRMRRLTPCTSLVLGAA